MVYINSARINPNNIYTKRDMWCHDVSLVISPANATDYEVEWHVMDPEIASINPSGYVLGLSPGTTRIYAMITDCSGRRIKSSIAEVTVDDYTDVTIDDMYTASRVMGVGDTITLEAVVTPERAATKGVIWCSTDPEVLSISQNGNELTVTALKLGNAVVVATPVDDMDISSCCTINVLAHVSVGGVTISRKAKTLDIGDYFKLGKTIFPTTASDRRVTWHSDKPSFVSVNDEGEVRALKEGTATVKVTVNSGRFTKVSRIIDKYRLNELPQLFNVFKGDMSFVGPRPERQYFIDKIRQENPNYDYVFLMRPGLTSMATVYNGYTDTMEKMLVRLDMDLEYLKTRSLWVDIKLIFITVFYIVNGKKF
jgi:uncharacterized protein YjdB